jgi:hypothetical protein
MVLRTQPDPKRDAGDQAFVSYLIVLTSGGSPPVDVTASGEAIERLRGFRTKLQTRPLPAAIVSPPTSRAWLGAAPDHRRNTVGLLRFTVDTSPLTRRTTTPFDWLPTNRTAFCGQCDRRCCREVGPGRQVWTTIRWVT